MTPAIALKLVRWPAPLTAPADVMLGYGLAAGRDALPPLPIVTASLLLYAAGMVLNDVADRQRDARARPERPIPAGLVTARGAAGLGASLLMAGALCAAWAGWLPGLVAWAIAATILIYDFGLKPSFVGSVIGMVACRIANVMLGVVAVAGTPALSLPLLLALAATALYIGGLTIASWAEDASLSPGGRWLAWLAILAALAAAASAGVSQRAPAVIAVPWVLALALAGAISRARQHLAGPAAGRFVGLAVRLYPLLCATALLASERWLGAGACGALALLATVARGRVS